MNIIIFLTKFYTCDVELLRCFGTQIKIKVSKVDKLIY
ncbi:hypothetical protein Goshw_020515 [Gossypium schwendimanii]|uniref:Uncharacterized protein n=1 Tax=Gossypium schwendimanii TaxID=34291 RepID=A0A7J9L4P0_GOSSC|nr:hypothetical protein [Gossypium schwendimanii]